MKPLPSMLTPPHPQMVVDLLRKKFLVYQTPNLKDITPEKFRTEIMVRLEQIDGEAEAYTEAELPWQRDLSVKFHWGHDHDFGNFRLPGRMGDRHITLLANFINLFPVTLDDFAGKDVFDIGCWTGGTALLLAALGGRVHAIEEVKKYADTAAFLAHSFGLDGQLSVSSGSLYDCNRESFQERFDIVFFPGVIYHLSDPVLGLRILFNSLKVGGIILVESAGIDNLEPICRFEGSRVVLSGKKEELNRGGWNWFIPSPAALARMMAEAGFEEVQSVMSAEPGRIFAYGKKLGEAGICRAGLSVPKIR